jgi:alanine racemase
VRLKKTVQKDAVNARSFNRVRVNCSALKHNFKLMQRHAGKDVPVMAMVKADGYGHGMVGAARAFADAGCQAFGVAELREGVALRDAEIDGDIYVTMGFSEDDAGYFFSHRLVPVIYDLERAAVLAMEARRRQTEIGVHVKLDTGMSRLGILPEEAEEFVATLSQMQGLRIAGLMSHFPEADQPVSPSTARAITTFSEIREGFAGKGLGLCHIANSGAVLNFPSACFDMVRVGIALYGYDPAGKGRAEGQADELRPAMEFRSRVLQVKTLPSGTGISYGHTFITQRETNIAVLPVGYEDGYSRLLSNRGQVLIGGMLAPIVGRVCMNMLMVDVTDIAGVAAGDEVILLGHDKGRSVSADSLAQLVGSINYEILCAIGNNNQREYCEQW